MKKKSIVKEKSFLDKFIENNTDKISALKKIIVELEKEKHKTKDLLDK